MTRESFVASPDNRHRDNMSANRVAFPYNIEAVLKSHGLKHVKEDITNGSEPRTRGDMAHYVVGSVVKRLMNEQYGINEADGANHFMHRRRLTVVIDRRCGANTLWFATLLFLQWT